VFYEVIVVVKKGKLCRSVSFLNKSSAKLYNLSVLTKFFNNEIV